MKVYTIEEVKDILTHASSTSKVYVGCDSINSKHFTTFATVVVLHIDGNRGARVFPFIETEPIYKSKRHALITEVHKATYMALQLIEAFPPERMEVHCDINTDPKHASNGVMKEAIAFVLGQNLKPIFKPHALAASSAGDFVGRTAHRNK